MLVGEFGLNLSAEGSTGYLRDVMTMSQSKTLSCESNYGVTHYYAFTLIPFLTFIYQETLSGNGLVEGSGIQHSAFTFLKYGASGKTGAFHFCAS